ncbi:MAG: thioredoxin fold domain-containing protein [Gammaproteobacteria bacterium]|nr:thioredoxin fold domain-containing protein [Gammaproteobacteria bacterium]
MFNHINSKFLFFLLLSLSIIPLQAKQEGSLAEGMVNPGYHEQPLWFKNSFLDINEDIAEARENGKRLMLFFYQDGCPYCKKLFEDNFGQRDIAEKIKNNFDVVAINLWGDREVTAADQAMTEKQFAEKLKVMYTPTLIFFNEEGQAILRANGYYHPGKFNAALDYVLGRHDKKEKFRSYLARVSPAPASGKIHRELETLKSPYRFDQPLSTGKYRLVMFEQKQCASCDELHQDILQRKESKALIKNFEVSVLDMWSDEIMTRDDGQQLKIRDWAKQLNIQYAPSMVFFDSSGKEVFRIEAYLKSFHIQSIMDYVASGSYKAQPNFQRYIDARAKKLEEMGIHLDLMN